MTETFGREFNHPVNELTKRGCSDSASNCSSKKSMCSNSNYSTAMKKTCAKTCGYC